MLDRTMAGSNLSGFTESEQWLELQERIKRCARESIAGLAQALLSRPARIRDTAWLERVEWCIARAEEPLAEDGEERPTWLDDLYDIHGETDVEVARRHSRLRLVVSGGGTGPGR